MGATVREEDAVEEPKLSFGRLLMSVPVDISDLVERDQTPMREFDFGMSENEESRRREPEQHPSPRR